MRHLPKIPHILRPCENSSQFAHVKIPHILRPLQTRIWLALFWFVHWTEIQKQVARHSIPNQRHELWSATVLGSNPKFKCFAINWQPCRLKISTETKIKIKKQIVPNSKETSLIIDQTGIEIRPTFGPAKTRSCPSLHRVPHIKPPRIENTWKTSKETTYFAY